MCQGTTFLTYGAMCKASRMTDTSQSTRRYGMTIPLGGPLGTQQEKIVELAELGYTDVWTAEAMGHDGFTPLVLASQWAPSLRLGTAIIPAFTRGAALFAQTVATMADVAPGRFVLGIGSSSNVIVENWNGIAFDEPYKRTRDMTAFLRASLTGEKVTETYDTFEVKGFRLGIAPKEPVPILIAALREGMLRLAGRQGDGAIINWLSADDVSTVTSIVHEAAGGESREIVARLFVLPSEDREAVLVAGRRAIAAYLNVPVYKAFHQWLGRTDDMAAHWERWDAGDRKGALAEIPEKVVDELFISGSPAECRAHIDRYFENGVTTAALAPQQVPGLDLDQAIRDLAPR